MAVNRPGQLFRLARDLKFRGILYFISYQFNRLRKVKPNAQSTSLSVRPATYDFFIFYQVYIEKQYQFNFLKTPKVMVDGGAHIGFFTTYMKRAFPDAQVICIEPDTENFRLLQRNTAHLTNVHLENTGLWGEATHLKLVDELNVGSIGLMASESIAGEGVKSLTMTQLMDKYGLEKIDVLKLDIEGSEKNLFESDDLSWLNKTEMIIIELSDWMRPGCSKAFFKAICDQIDHFEYYSKGENVIILNKSLNPEGSIRVPI